MRRIVVLGIVAFALLTGLNLIELARSGGPFDAVTILLDLIDTALLVAAIGIIAFIAVEGRELARQRAGLAESLDKARAEGDQWRRTAQAYLQGLGEAINAQFRTWRLSASEADIAMLLLKGLSHKEIAGLRATSEATVRQQARSIYQKSGLSSRAELAAYFLEDLTAPADASATDGVVTQLMPRSEKR